MQHEHAIMAHIMGSLEMAYELWPPKSRPNVPEVKAAFDHLRRLLSRRKLDGVLVRSLAIAGSGTVVGEAVKHAVQVARGNAINRAFHGSDQPKE